MKKYLVTVFSVLFVFGLVSWYSIFLLKKIDLTTADLGRHIQNGAIVLHGSSLERTAVLHANFYSYTETNYPFINHHWGSGVVFFLLWSWFGFTGLSIFYGFLGAATLLVFFLIARKQSSLVIAGALTALLIPLMASRNEVRPEMFTYFFSGVFFWVLTREKEAVKLEIDLKRQKVWIWSLPVFMLFWVNLHVGFFFGLLLILTRMFELLGQDFIENENKSKGLFIRIRNAFRNKEFINLGVIFIFCFIASLLNPNTILGALYPLNIFKNYGYLIVENQSIPFLEQISHSQGLHFTLFKIVAIFGFLTFVIAIFKLKCKIRISYVILFVLVTIMGYFGIRNFPFFGFFMLPILAYLIFSIISEKLGVFGKAVTSSICGLIIVAAGYSGFLLFSEQSSLFGLGLLPGVNNSAEFFSNHNIQGPIFNDYDIGSYLIYHLYPEKVFVDNRPEAYPVSFFEQDYIPGQADEKKWQELNLKHKFNAIFFSHRDLTPWAQAFLIARVKDSEWAPVFADNYNIIFLKRNLLNDKLIKQFEVPKSAFGLK